MIQRALHVVADALRRTGSGEGDGEDGLEAGDGVVALLARHLGGGGGGEGNLEAYPRRQLRSGPRWLVGRRPCDSRGESERNHFLTARCNLITAAISFPKACPQGDQRPAIGRRKYFAEIGLLVDHGAKLVLDRNHERPGHEPAPPLNMRVLVRLAVAGSSPRLARYKYQVIWGGLILNVPHIKNTYDVPTCA